MVVSCLSAFAIGVAACFLMSAIPFILFVFLGVGVGMMLDAYQCGSVVSAATHGAFLLCATEIGYAVGLVTKLLTATLLGRAPRSIVVREAIRSTPGSRSKQPQARP